MGLAFGPESSCGCVGRGFDLGNLMAATQLHHQGVIRQFQARSRAALGMATAGHQEHGDTGLAAQLTSHLGEAFLEQLEPLPHWQQLGGLHRPDLPLRQILIDRPHWLEGLDPRSRAHQRAQSG